MAEIPFGPWHPDKAGINVKACRDAQNCLPAVNGYQPLRAPVAATTALTGSCVGAAVVFDDTGVAATFAGDATKLYRLDTSSTWNDVTRTAGGAYSSGSGERWQFAFSGGLVIAVTIADFPQKYLLGTSTNFQALGGTPPKSRFVAVVRDFVVLGCLFTNERQIAWSAIANPESWTAGISSSDVQTFQNGGPVRGLIGGEVGYVLQAEKITRMTFQSGSTVVFQFDEVEGGRGIAAPYSLVKIGNLAYYMAADGFYEFSLQSASSKPLGVGKWAEAFIADLKSGTEQTVIGGVDPTRRLVMWAYNSASNATTSLDKILIYNWALDEAVTASVTITALAQILTQDLTLDSAALAAFGNLDTLPFSLDSPVWRGGSSLLGVFGTDKKMALFSGSPLEATWVTNDGELPARSIVKGIRPHVDTRAITAEIAAREAEGDSVSYGNVEVMEDTGVISTWASGWLARARLKIPAGTNWSKITAVDAVIGSSGGR